MVGKPMKCGYCEGELDGSQNIIYKHLRFYHVTCYISWVHDLATTIRLKATNIVEYTQGNNSAANSEARRILEIVEKF